MSKICYKFNLKRKRKRSICKSEKKASTVPTRTVDAFFSTPAIPLSFQIKSLSLPFFSCYEFITVTALEKVVIRHRKHLWQK